MIEKMILRKRKELGNINMKRIRRTITTEPDTTTTIGTDTLLDRNCTSKVKTMERTSPTARDMIIVFNSLKKVSLVETPIS